MNTDDYLDGINDIADMLDNSEDDELWDRLTWTVLALAAQLGVEVEITHG